jgi:hypothetical protein
MSISNYVPPQHNSVHLLSRMFHDMDSFQEVTSEMTDWKLTWRNK